MALCMFALEESGALRPEVCTAPPPTAGAIFAEHHGFVWRALTSLGVERRDVEDALQEVFVVVHKRLHEYQEQQKVKAWLYSISVRVARDFRRKRWRQRESGGDVLPEIPGDPSQLENVANRQALELAHRLLRELPEKLSAVFLLYEVEQMPMSEVALAIGCPLQTAYSRLKIARERVLVLATRAARKGEVP